MNIKSNCSVLVNLQSRLCMVHS